MLFNGIVETYLEPIGQAGGFMLIFCAAMWTIFLVYEIKRRKGKGIFKKINFTDFVMTRFLKILSFGGFVIGAACVIVGIVGLVIYEPPSAYYYINTENSANLFTCVVLIVFGILTYLKPVNDLSLASIAGSFAGFGVGALIIAILLFLDITISYTIALTVLIVVIVVFSIVAVIVKFWILPFEIASKIISYPLILFIGLILLSVQGYMVLYLGTSLF